MRKIGHKTHPYVLVVGLLLVILMRFVLSDHLNPLERSLETLAFMVQHREESFGEAIAAFCLEVFCEGG